MTTYELRRNSYLAHIMTCRSCVSSYSGSKYELDNAGNRLRERFKTVSQFCDEARKLLEAILG